MNKPTRAGPIGLCSGLLLCVALFLGAPSVWAADCKFVLGFATLKALIDEAAGPDKVGQCLENERFNPENGDALQQTTGGLLVWRKADNWTAFTDGYRTWINGPYGLQMRLNTEHFDWEVPAALKLEVLKNAEYLSDWPTGGKANADRRQVLRALRAGIGQRRTPRSERVPCTRRPERRRCCRCRRHPGGQWWRQWHLPVLGRHRQRGGPAAARRVSLAR